MKTVSVKIRKPLYGNYVYIRDVIIDRAISSGARLKITVPNGSAVVDPAEWKRNGKIMKKVFKIPSCPMILYGGNVPLPVKIKGEVFKKKIESKQIKLL